MLSVQKNSPEGSSLPGFVFLASVGVSSQLLRFSIVYIIIQIVNFIIAVCLSFVGYADKAHAVFESIYVYTCN